MGDAGEQVLQLWNYMAPTIEAQIMDKGNFSSWAAKLTTNGKIEVTLCAILRKDRALFRPVLREEAATGRLVAIASVTNVVAEVAESPEPVAGILLEFDNSDGVSQATFQPYSVAEGKLVLGELHVEQGDHAVFA